MVRVTIEQQLGLEPMLCRRWNQLIAASSNKTERFRISTLSAVPVLEPLNCQKCKLEVKFCRKFKRQRDWRNRRSRYTPYKEQNQYDRKDECARSVLGHHMTPH